MIKYEPKIVEVNGHNSLSRSLLIKTANRAAPEMTCTASTHYLTGDGVYQTHITMSVNDGPKVTYSQPTNGESPIEYEKRLAKMMYMAQDGISPAFFMSEQLGPDMNPVIGDGVKTLHAFLGVHSDGTVLHGGTRYKLNEGFYHITDLMNGIFVKRTDVTIVPETNILRIHPTPGVPHRNDSYSSFSTVEGGPPVEFISCAKLVSTAPVVAECVPTETEILYDPNWNNRVPDVAPLHARYKINDGAWIDYRVEMGEFTDHVRQFFDTIRLPNGQQMIETSGDSTHTPFRSYQGTHELIGASAGETLSRQQRSVIKEMSTEIKFEVTQNNFNDLVYLAFGQNTTVHSCALAEWDGL